MKHNTLFTRLQTLFGVTKTELTVVIVILSGLLIGTLYNYFNDNDSRYNYALSQDVYRLLDSIAEVQRTTYTGTDLRGNPDKELASADTIVARDSFFLCPKRRNYHPKR